VLLLASGRSGMSLPAPSGAKNFAEALLQFAISAEQIVSDGQGVKQ